MVTFRLHERFQAKVQLREALVKFDEDDDGKSEMHGAADHFQGLNLQIKIRLIMTSFLIQGIKRVLSCYVVH